VTTTLSSLRIALVALLAVALVLVPAAAAGKGKGKPGGGTNSGGGTIKLVPLNSTDGLPHFGQKVTFSVYTTATSYPWVDVKCYRSGSMVYEQANGIFATSLNQVFTLGPTPSWTGGAADCTSYLQNWDGYSKGKIVTLASLGFHVYA
jgi:hypothetical protein